MKEGYAVAAVMSGWLAVFFRFGLRDSDAGIFFVSVAFAFALLHILTEIKERL